MKYILFIMGLLCSYVSMAIEPVKEGNVIAGHVIEKGSENSLPLIPQHN